jgi:hypothetical protein
LNKVELHIYQRFPADGALIRVRDVFLVAEKMYGMPAGHEYYGSSGVE